MHTAIETTISEIGTIKLDSLPFVPGDKVEIILLKRRSRGQSS